MIQSSLLYLSFNSSWSNNFVDAQMIQSVLWTYRLMKLLLQKFQNTIQEKYCKVALNLILSQNFLQQPPENIYRNDAWCAKKREDAEIPKCTAKNAMFHFVLTAASQNIIQKLIIDNNTIVLQ